MDGVRGWTDSLLAVSEGRLRDGKIDGKAANAAEQFEAMLIGSMLEGMEKTFGGLPGASGLAGSDDYRYLATQALAEGIAARGGFGIAKMIREDLKAHQGNR